VYFAKETSDYEEPNDRSHPIPEIWVSFVFNDSCSSCWGEHLLNVSWRTHIWPCKSNMCHGFDSHSFPYVLWCVTLWTRDDQILVVQNFAVCYSMLQFFYSVSDLRHRKIVLPLILCVVVCSSVSTMCCCPQFGTRTAERIHKHTWKWKHISVYVCVGVFVCVCACVRVWRVCVCACVREYVCTCVRVLCG